MDEVEEVSVVEKLRDPEVTVTAPSSDQLHNTDCYFTDVVVIGNGPSGLALSSFLSGWQPFYNLESPHPNRLLHENLSKKSHQSLVEQDMNWLTSDEAGDSTTLFDHGGMSNRAFPQLYDSLVRPDADIGHDHGSSLQWSKSKQVVPHVVLGKGPTGGGWADFSPEVYTLSLAGWMDLPAFSFEEWSSKYGKGANEFPMVPQRNVRVPSALVQQYFHAYPHLVGIDKHMFPYTEVTSVLRVSEEENVEFPWFVTAYNSMEGPLYFRAKHLCAANGVGVPKELQVPGEDLENVFHSVRELEMALEQGLRQKSSETVLVIGDGPSAVDVVLHCMVHRIPVVHSFKHSARELKRTLVGGLSASVYPEYNTVFRLMTGKAEDPLYKPFPNSKIVQFSGINNNQCTAELFQTTTTGQTPAICLVPFSYAVICIGFVGQLNFFSPSQRDLITKRPGQPLNGKENSGDVNQWNYGHNRLKNLYLLGPLAGDNFVRFLVGGCLAVARDILRNTAPLVHNSILELDKSFDQFFEDYLQYDR